jgi:hypothetical protein
MEFHESPCPYHFKFLTQDGMDLPAPRNTSHCSDPVPHPGVRLTVYKSKKSNKVLEKHAI